MSEKIHWGFISSIKFDNLTPWFTTTQANQVINFIDSQGTQRNLNALLIEAESTDLYIRILPSDYCIFVPAYGSQNINLQDIQSIQVMNQSGVKLRWSGQYH